MSAKETKSQILKCCTRVMLSVGQVTSALELGLQRDEIRRRATAARSDAESLAWILGVIAEQHAEKKENVCAHK